MSLHRHHKSMAQLCGCVLCRVDVLISDYPQSNTCIESPKTMKFHTFSHHFLNVMEKAMKFHTRRHHIRHNEKKQVKKAQIWVP